ncbi:MAG: hypothetical protein RLZZ350_838 [Verrucomicrobiota bacterium]
MKFARQLSRLAVFAGGLFAAAAQTNSPAPIFVPIEVLESAASPNPDTLAAHQFVTVGAPASPTKFNPDSGAKPSATQPEILPPPTLERRREITVTAPDSPTVFNPDPGARFKVAPVNPPPFYTNEVPAAASFTGEPVPSELALPRTNVRRDELVLTNPPAGNFGHEPLPPGMELPRLNARGNQFIKEKWESPHYAPNNGYSYPPRNLEDGKKELPISISRAFGKPNANEPITGNSDRTVITPFERVKGYNFPPNSVPMTNRWRIGFAPWKRYAQGSVENPYETPQPLLWRPYRQSILKGDAPIIGQDIFLDLTASSTTEFEARRTPVPSGVSSSGSGSAEFFGASEQEVVQQNFAFSVQLFKGETVFQPVHWALEFEPVVNVNYVNTRENNLINPNPQRGTDRTDYYIALQQAFLELHLGDLSENYDFCALKLGNQPFISDFRGFIFNDVNLGARFFGNFDNNRWQYNLAVFDMNEKDSNSDLNTFDQRDQVVVVANVYKQDFIWHGYTLSMSLHANLDDGKTHYDRNGNLTRPEPLGTLQEHSVHAYYLGWAGDGHIGRWNVSHAFYQVLGHDEFNGLAGRAVDINAQMAALEISYDRDWVRYKASLFYASGDSNPTDGEANGFDTILDNPNFTGGPFSWYVRQGFNLAGTGVGLKPRASLVPSMRSSKSEGQANFVNPGVFIAGLGVEIDVTPKLRTFLNANYIHFMETAPIKTALLTDKVDHELGWDLSLGAQYRPALTDNIIISAGFGVLIPGAGYKDIYQTSSSPVPGYGSPSAGSVDDFLYSAIVAVTLTY